MLISKEKFNFLLSPFFPTEESLPLKMTKQILYREILWLVKWGENLGKFRIRTKTFQNLKFWNHPQNRKRSGTDTKNSRICNGGVMGAARLGAITRETRRWRHLAAKDEIKLLIIQTIQVEGDNARRELATFASAFAWRRRGAYGGCSRVLSLLGFLLKRWKNSRVGMNFWVLD